MIYLLALAFALSLVCTAGTWCFYRVFVQFVHRFDERAIRRWSADDSRAQNQRGDDALQFDEKSPDAEESHAATEEYWPEIIDG